MLLHTRPISSSALVRLGTPLAENRRLPPIALPLKSAAPSSPSRIMRTAAVRARAPNDPREHLALGLALLGRLLDVKQCLVQLSRRGWGRGRAQFRALYPLTSEKLQPAFMVGGMRRSTLQRPDRQRDGAGGLLRGPAATQRIRSERLFKSAG